MNPAIRPRDASDGARMLVIDGDRLVDERIEQLPERLRRGDLLVVNDAATLPASMRAATPGGAPLEIRLAARQLDGTWQVVLFGDGDWHVDRFQSLKGFDAVD